MSKRDFYEVLGVSHRAGDGEIKSAYRRLAKKYHPDQNKGDADAERKFKEVQEAYSVLSNQEKRARYDQFGHAGVDPQFSGAGRAHWSTADGTTIDFDTIADMFDFGGARGGVGSLFEELLGRTGRSRAGAHPPAGGSDIETSVTLTFDQAIRGSTLDLRLSGANGETTDQTISVRIPPGVHDGQRIRIRGKGRPGRRGGAPGDLYVVCRVQPHPYFQRIGDDIYLQVPITISEAALGGKVDVPTPDGVRTVSIPPGTSSGTKLRLAEQGVARSKGGGRGDFYTVIKIVPPKTMTGEQRRAMQRFADADATNPREGLWD